MKRLATIVAVAILAVLSRGEAAGSGAGRTGMLFGANHAFHVTAPKGWVLDNKSGVPQGLHMLFYPAGFSWAESPVFAYGRSVTKATGLRTIADQVRSTVDGFHRDGSPNYRSVEAGRVKLAGGRVVHLYSFSGDRWGNHESAGYVEEEETINFLVFSARKKEDFDRYLPGFKSMLRTYRNVYSREIDDRAFSRFVDEARRLAGTKKGKEYESRLLKKLGPPMADIMRVCTSYASKEGTPRFELILRVGKSGRPAGIHSRPSNALTTCVKGMIRPLVHPPHDFDAFVGHIEMEIRE